MGPLGAHLGARTSDLLDGRLPADEADRAWLHVQGCRHCHDQVERESWVKRRLAHLAAPADGLGAAPDSLRGALLSLTPTGARPGPASALPATPRARSRAGVAALGSGAVGVAVMGVLALGAAPASAPAPGVDRRAPVTQLGPVVPLRGATDAAGHAHRAR